MYQTRTYKAKDDPDYRPNTRKMFEDHHGVKVPKGMHVHHCLPTRLGGAHEVSNLIALTTADHAQAHLDLFKEHGDPRDLCAHYMIQGLSDEARRVASAEGGRAGQAAMRARGQVNGFGVQSAERRKQVAAIGGRVGGAMQRDAGIGIHVDAVTRAGWARLGAGAVAEQFSDPVVQSSRGKRGGVKNKGSKWCHDGVKSIKYTAAQQAVEPFEDYVARNGYFKGRP